MRVKGGKGGRRRRVKWGKGGRRRRRVRREREEEGECEKEGDVCGYRKEER